MRTFRAEPADIERILPCARAFCSKLGWPLDESAYILQMMNLISGGRGAIFLLEDGGEIVGGLGGSIENDEISNRPLAVEKFWYVDEAHRATSGAIKLLALFERWADQSGAVHKCMIAMEASDPEKMDALYRRLGYRKLQTTYIK
jgi:RimJ/RimL family protein N-acetyltransferase